MGTGNGACLACNDIKNTLCVFHGLAEPVKMRPGATGVIKTA